MRRPVLTIIAGSNGCGKSTLTWGARSKLQATPILDPDAMAKSIQETGSRKISEIEVGKEVLRRAEALIQSRQSFVVETTLSGSTYLRMAKRAKAAGFNIAVFFVGTTSVEINLLRVKARVMLGGHDVSEADQRRRFPRTLANIRRLLPIADLALIYDNSTDQGHVLVGTGHASLMHWIEPVPEWAKYLIG